MSDGQSEVGRPVGDQRFTTTHWSVVVSCGADDTVSSGAAMEQLCHTYWYPLYAYVRRRGHSVEEAQDLTQEFFARFIEKEWVTAADANKGQFRTFLLTAVGRFLAKEWRHATTAKRGGGQVLIPLDELAESRYAREPASEAAPDKLYECRWALSVFEQALSKLRERYAAVGRAAHYDRLKGFLSTQPDEGDYARLARELQLTRGAIAAAVYRMRQHYRQLVRDEVAQTVNSPEEFDEEMRWLLNTLRYCGSPGG